MGRRGGAWAAEGGLCLGTGAGLSQGLRSLPVGFGVTQEMECLGGWGRSWPLMAPCCFADGDPPAAGRTPGSVCLLAPWALRTLSQHSLINKNPAPKPVSCLPALATGAHVCHPQETLVGALSGPWFSQLSYGLRPSGTCSTPAPLLRT